ncbi:MAG: adenosine deaminase [Shimia sp.]
MSWRSFPKVELHLHLEGAAPPAFVRSLAAEAGLRLDGVFDEDGHYAYRDFAEFLRVYEAATAALRGPEAYRRLTRAVLEGLAAESVVYAEVFLSPDFCGGGDLGAWREHLAAIEEAQMPGVTMRGIVTCIRHLGPDQARRIARCAAETSGGFVRGFGIAGAETVGEPRDFAWAFDCAREAELRLTAHAGEWRGPESVRAAWCDLRVERIGHGVRAIEDDALVADLAEAGVVLECCPGSNVALGVYPTIAHHPIAMLRDRGVRVTVSTDDPPFFHTTMTREFEELDRAFGWGAEDFAALNRTALDAAFCDDDTRAAVARRLAATE